MGVSERELNPPEPTLREPPGRPKINASAPKRGDCPSQTGKGQVTSLPFSSL